MGLTSVKKLTAVAVKSKLGIVKRLLHSRIGGYDRPRSKKNIHASELTYEEREFCPRQYRLMDLYPDVEDKQRHISTAQAFTFNEGHDKQARINNEYLRDVMVGKWKCTSCGMRKPFGPAPRTGCDDPQSRCNFIYEEMRVEDPVTGTSGGLDGLLMIKKGEKLRLLECKIIDKDYYKKQVAPFAEHRVRTRLYLRLIAQSNQSWTEQVDTSEASILYIMRGFGAKDEEGEITPFREYVITREDDEVNDYLALAHAVTASRRDPDLGFPCGICSNMMAPNAKACPVSKQCFSSKHPPKITWTVGGTPKHKDHYVEWIADGTELKPASQD